MREGDRGWRNNSLDGIAFVAEVVEVVVDGGFVDGFFIRVDAAGRGGGLLLLLVEVGESFVVGDSLVDLEDEVGECGWGEVNFLVVGDFAEVAVEGAS